MNNFSYINNHSKYSEMYSGAQDVKIAKNMDMYENLESRFDIISMKREKMIKKTNKI